MLRSMLDISANAICETFEEDAYELVIVEDVAALQHTLGQFVSILLGAEAMVA